MVAGRGLRNAVVSLSTPSAATAVKPAARCMRTVSVVWGSAASAASLKVWRPERQSSTATTSISTMRSGWASLLTSIVVLVGMAPKYSRRTSVCLKNSSMFVT